MSLALTAIEMWSWAREGHLPEAGGYLEQGEYLLELIETVSGAFGQWLKTLRKS